MFLEDDFFHHSMPIVTDRGIKLLSSIVRGDSLAAIDISNGITYVKPSIQETLRRGMYYDIETSLGNIKLGLNAEMYYLQRNQPVAIKSHEIADTLIGETIKIPSPAKSQAPNLYPQDAKFIVLMALLALSGARVKGSRIEIPYSTKIDSSGALNIFEQLKITYATFQRNKSHYIDVYHGIPNFDTYEYELNKDNINLLGTVQSQLFRDVYVSFAGIIVNSKGYEQKGIYVQCPSELTHLISVIFIKAGYACKHTIIIKNKRQINVIKHTVASTFDCTINAAYLCQHEKMDRHIWLPDIYKGIIGVVDGRYVLLPTQKMM